MRCEPFAALLLDLLRNSGHEQIQSVRTFTEAGFHKPVGLEITAADGFTTYVQVVRTSPPGGDVDDWGSSPEYKATWAPRTPNPLRWDGKPVARNAVPELKVNGIEALIQSVLLAADHPDIAEVRTYAEAGLDGGKPHGIKVTCSDLSHLFVVFYGVARPGEAKPSHPEYQIPKEFMNVPIVRTADVGEARRARATASASR